jgi:arylsulfatase A-like enzyme
MNFQSVSTAQKLPTSDGLTGGYLPGGKVPGPLLSGALDFVDRELGAMVSELAAQGLAGSTSIIVSAKHGQSPTDPAALTRIPDGPILTALNKAWTDAHPGAGDLVAFSTDDDIMQLWLTHRSAAATAFVRQYLLAHSAAGNTVSGASRTLPASGLSRVYAGAAAAQLVGVPAGEPRHPDVIGIVQHGVVYTSGAGKIAEHGGADPQDRDVPLLVAGAGVGHGRTVDSRVQTTQIAPTILRLLGLDPHALKAVREQGTRILPGLQRDS